jgi:type VI secretion system protein ImpG
MDNAFLRHYEQELRYLRTSASDFATKYEWAKMLSLDRFPCPDPYVERLLEGSAYLAARIQQRIDEGYPRFVEALFNCLYPNYLGPTPACVIAQFLPADHSADALKDGRLIARHSPLVTTPVSSQGARCTFLTAHPITLLPINVVSARYHDRDLGSLGMPDLALPTPARACLRITIKADGGIPWSKLRVPNLDFYLGHGNEASHRVYDAMTCSKLGCCVRWASKHQPTHWFDPDRLWARPMGFATDQSLLPTDPRSFDGYRLLQEYFAFPARFMFLSVADLSAATKLCDSDTLDLLFPLPEEDTWLSRNPDLLQCFSLGCTPAINLFPMEADHIQVREDRTEYQIVADGARELDFEAYRVQSVVGYDARSGGERAFLPFYESIDPSRGGSNLGGYFSLRRLPRDPVDFERRSGRQGEYVGSDLYLSLTDPDGRPELPALDRLRVSGLFTNRDLPLFMWADRRERAFEGGGGIQQVKLRCLTPPSLPAPGVSADSAAWRLIGHLGLNFFPIADQNDQGEVAAAAIRNLCRLYIGRVTGSGGGNHWGNRLADAVRSLRCQSIVRALPGEGPLSIVRGLEVALNLDLAAFAGQSVMVFSGIMEHFLARHVSINSFIEFSVADQLGKEFHRWPSRVGKRPLL